MRVLEARLRVTEIGGPDYLTMGYFVWDENVVGKPPRVQPASSPPWQEEPSAILATLQRLARMAGPNTFDGLKALRNRYWAFVEIEGLPT